MIPPSDSSTDADRVNQKLVDQYTEIARLAGGLAHEIKNPLSTIRLNMELLAEDLGTPETPRERRAEAQTRTFKPRQQTIGEVPKWS